ncbi:MAG: hypothetical protein Q7T82_11530 [Armatimonadota bacterium]|nr:hypothetical protein [Armatimonadota bacterium]
MLGSAVLETAIGLVFIYLVLSIIGTALVEACSAVTNCRGTNLKKWIEKMLGEKNAKVFYDLPLIVGLRKQSPHEHLTYPSYIPEKTFAEALTYILAGRQYTNDLNVVSQGAQGLDGTGIGDVVSFLVQKANGNFEVFQSELAKWFTDCQDRVTGWFKVSSVKILIVSGFVIAVVCNVDTMQIANTLYKQTELRQGIAAASGKADSLIAPDELKELEKAGLVGWGEDGFLAYWKQKSTGGTKPAPTGQAAGEANAKPSDKPKGKAVAQPSGAKPGKVHDKPSSGFAGNAVGEKVGKGDKPDSGLKVGARVGGMIIAKIIGCLLTALAMSLGAPYWFEVLNKMNETIRATGPKPAAQSQTQSSAKPGAGEPGQDGQRLEKPVTHPKP